MRLMLLPLLLGACHDKTDDPLGTEIGDEGHERMCAAENTPLDAATVPAGFSETPAEHLVSLTGDFDAQDLATVTPDLSSIEFVDMEPIPWEGDADETVPPEPVCIDQVYVPITLDIGLPDLTLSTPVADIAWTVDETRLSAHVQTHFSMQTDPNDDEGGTDEGGEYETGTATWETAWDPTTFDPDQMQEVLLRVDGVPVADGWEFTFSWIATSHPEGPDGNVSSYDEEIDTRVFQRAI